MKLVDPSREWRIEENFFRVQDEVDINIAWRPGKSLDSLRQDEPYAPSMTAVAKIQGAAS